MPSPTEITRRFRALCERIADAQPAGAPAEIAAVVAVQLPDGGGRAELVSVTAAELAAAARRLAALDDEELEAAAREAFSGAMEAIDG